jgi:TPR repeat protein
VCTCQCTLNEPLSKLNVLEELAGAYERGDQVLAVQHFRTLADQGIAPAQWMIGWTYHRGFTVPQDLQEAMRWYRKAAEQGHARSHLALGILYENGEGGIPHDVVRAHMWYSLAADAITGKYREIAREYRNDAAARMTDAQIQNASDMARQCWESQFKDCDYSF